MLERANEINDRISCRATKTKINKKQIIESHALLLLLTVTRALRRNMIAHHSIINMNKNVNIQ